MNLDNTAPSSDYGSYINSRNPRLSTSENVRSESVDLLQMVPEVNRSRGQEYGLSRSLGRDGSPRQSRLLLDEEEDQDEEDGLSSCPHCKEEGIYYSRLEQPRDFSNSSNCERGNDDSSVFFDYVRRNPNRTRMSESTTALYDRAGRARQKQLWGQGCCGSATMPSQSLSNVPRSPVKRNNNGKPSNHEISYVTHTVMKTKSQRRSKIRKMLFLLCVLVGILVALTGIIVGFAVLAPFDDSGAGCASAYVSCPSRGCLLLKDLCDGTERPCVDIAYDALCKTHNNTSSKSPQGGLPIHGVATLQPSLEQPTLDERGWAYYSKGSATGSMYKVLNKIMTFESAQEECRKFGGHLAHVNTMREQIVLENFLREQLRDDDISRTGMGFWIGARRKRGSHGARCLYNQWKWVDAYGRQFGVVGGFTAFAPGRPDNAFSPEECLYMISKTDEPEQFLQWDDAPCDLTTVSSIKVLCEVELS